MTKYEFRQANLPKDLCYIGKKNTTTRQTVRAAQRTQLQQVQVELSRWVADVVYIYVVQQRLPLPAFSRREALAALITGFSISSLVGFVAGIWLSH